MSYRELLKGPLPSVDGRELAPSDCVIFYGTFPAMRQIQLHHPWVPGGWCDPVRLDCTSYYAHFGPYLLNRRYAMMPGVEAVRLKDWLFERLGKDDEVFARPTSVHKLFVGRRIHRDEFETALAPTRYDPTTMVLVAEPRELGREWRLVVCGDEVIAGSQYAVGGKRNVSSATPDEVLAFARSALAVVRWRPDELFMLDVCESEGQLRLVELNSFSCSGLYACQLPRVVEAASRAAVRARERANG